ncbi:MAG: tetratricopeptide repeat protein [Calditrichaceae bacterium]
MKKVLMLFILFIFGAQMLFAQEEARKAEAAQPYNTGLEFARKEKYNDAIEQFKKAIEADSNFPDAHYMLAYCYKKLNNYKEAEAQYKKAIGLDSKFEKAYIALANLQEDADRMSDAVSTFKAVLALFNAFSAWLYFLAFKRTSPR